MGAGLIGGILQGASGLISTISGIAQKHQGNKIINGLQYPTEDMPSEVGENQGIARNMAATGLPSEQYNMAMRNIQRQQLNALKGAQDRRGGLGMIGNIQQATNDATLNLDAANANARLANQKLLMNANQQAANWKDRLFNNNVKGKYDQQYNYGMGLLGAGNANLVGGFDRFATAGGMIANKNNNQNTYTP